MRVFTATLDIAGGTMWIRTVMLMCAIGCVMTGNSADDRQATVEQRSMSFECLNDTAIHVVTCHGSISLFPLTITIEDIRILSDNEISILNDSLNDLSILDGGLLNYNEILDDAEAFVLDDLVNGFLIEVNDNQVGVCTTVGGLPVCK
jgi:hypothetical protein